MGIDKKSCTNCGKLKRISEFSKRAAKKDGLRSQCKSCDSVDNKRQAKKRSSGDERKRMLKYKYGLTLDCFDRLIKKQNYRCGICRTSNFEVKGKSNPHVDHCHKTGEIRGILCSKCNTALGLFKDSIKNLKSAIKYLEKHKK